LKTELQKEKAMKNVLKKGLFVLLTLGSASAWAAPTEWRIDASHSSAQFSVRHMMVSNVRGEFSSVTGKATIDDADLSKSQISAEIDVATINTREPKRDEHLKSPDFFDAAKFPKLTFKSTKIEKAGAQFKVTGDLTMHGVTKTVVLTADVPAQTVRDPYGNIKRGMSAQTKLSRKEFGLTWNKVLETGGAVVGDEIQVTIDLELAQLRPGQAKPEAGAAKK
jgi:polyisoprenoid-binding protein YceI